MSVQLGLVFRDAALDSLDRSHVVWIARCVQAIAMLRPGLEFTTDDLWPIVGETREPRAMGAALRAARTDGLVVATGGLKRSTRPACHARPLTVWRRTL